MTTARESADAVTGRVEATCQKYGITTLRVFLDSVRILAAERILNVAVLGRFKAGKSSFLNHLLGRPLLPVGVIPVTSVVTELEYGAEERAEVRLLNGRIQEVSSARIDEYVSEQNNPGNEKGVAAVRIQLPSMAAYRNLRLVDTPGLESVLEQNTGASLDWLPHVGLALVAVGVDPPLSKHDLELIRRLRRYTPNIEILLTKVDLLTEHERTQVMDFISGQLSRHRGARVRVHPYSTRPGFEEHARQVEESLLERARTGTADGAEETLRHKLDSLLSECRSYLQVALKAAEVADSERESLRARILGQKEGLDDARLALSLTVRHTIASLRPTYEALLKPEEAVVRQRLLAALDTEFPNWAHSLQVATVRFEEWLRALLAKEMGELSSKHERQFIAPIRRSGRQLAQSLQDFRNRISESALEALGVPLQTRETDLAVEAPRRPDIRAGKIFDHNWELLSWIVPMTLVRAAVWRHFERKAGDAVFMNISRLVSQWEEIMTASLRSLEKQSLERLTQFITTVESLIDASRQRAPEIIEDLRGLEDLRSKLGGKPQATWQS